MSRKTFYEIIDDMGIDPGKEYKRINEMFAVEKAINDYGHSISLQYYINVKHFRYFSFRGTYTDVVEMKNDILGERLPDEIDLNTLFVFFEFLFAIFSDFKVQRDYMVSHNSQAKTIIENILKIVEKTNHKMHNLGEELNPKYIIVENNKAATRAAELVESQPVAIEIIEYNHASMRGDINKKRKVLDSIGLYIEPLLKTHKLKNAGYVQLESDAGFMLNNFHVRHNNKEGRKAQEYIIGISDNQLEEWYDKIYNTLLSVIIISEEIDISSELSDLKNTYSWRT